MSDPYAASRLAEVDEIEKSERGYQDGTSRVVFIVCREEVGSEVMQRLRGGCRLCLCGGGV